MNDFDFTKTLQELDAGVFASKLTEAIKDVALGVVTHSKVGSVTIELKMKRLGESNQIMLDHTLKYSRPTLRGKVGEENATSTTLYVAGNGAISIMPETQTGFNFETEE